MLYFSVLLTVAGRLHAATAYHMFPHAISEVGSSELWPYHLPNELAFFFQGFFLSVFLLLLLQTKINQEILLERK